MWTYDDIDQPLRKAAAVLNAIIGAEHLSEEDFRCLAYVALDYIEDCQDVIDPQDRPRRMGATAQRVEANGDAASDG